MGDSRRLSVVLGLTGATDPLKTRKGSPGHFIWWWQTVTPGDGAGCGMGIVTPQETMRALHFPFQVLLGRYSMGCFLDRHIGDLP